MPDCTAQYNAMILAIATAAVEEAEAAVELAEAEIAQGEAADAAQAAWDAEVAWLYCEGGGGSSRMAGPEKIITFARGELRRYRSMHMTNLKELLEKCREHRDMVRKDQGLL